jgi:adenosylcobinamide-phosphate synthase
MSVLGGCLRAVATDRLLAVAAALVADRLTREPPNPVHPVALFGRAMQWTERRIWADHRARGALYTGVGVAGAAAVGAAARSVAVTLWVAVAGNELRRTARRIADRVEGDDLNGARNELPSLVGRDPSALDAAGISAAVIESVAENTVDAVVAPVFWALVAGAPGAAAYRAINTMDAMVGHRSERYERFGWASARLDDVANWIPARLFALLVVVQQPTRAREVLAVVRRDSPAHPSPNAGVAESAMAAAIGRQLGGPLRYGERREERPTLGDGPRPGGADVASAIAISSRAEWLLAAGVAAAWILRSISVWRCGRT